MTYYACVSDRIVGDPNCVWESVERRLSNMEGMLRELRKNADDHAGDCGAIHSGPVDLSAHLSDLCAAHSTHPIGKCSGYKRHG